MTGPPVGAVNRPAPLVRARIEYSVVPLAAYFVPKRTSCSAACHSGWEYRVLPDGCATVLE